MLDVDDKELLLTRFRLLGTGFFRDVQLSLRRGTKRGYVILAGRRRRAEHDRRQRSLARPLCRRRAERQRAPAHRVRRHRRLGDRTSPAPASRSAERSRSPIARSRSARASATPTSCARRGPPRRSSSTTTRRTSSATATCSSTTRPRWSLRTSPSSATSASAVWSAPATRSAASRRASSSTTASRRSTRSLPRAASHLRGLDVEPIDFDLRPGSSLLSTVSATLVHDTRDEPFLPTRGWHVLGLAEASLTPLGSDYPYTKLVLRGSRWMPLPWDHVLRIEGILGSVFGDAPLYEKFYVGDYTDLRPHRALDLAFDRRAAPNFLQHHHRRGPLRRLRRARQRRVPHPALPRPEEHLRRRRLRLGGLLRRRQRS